MKQLQSIKPFFVKHCALAHCLIILTQFTACVVILKMFGYSVTALLVILMFVSLILICVLRDLDYPLLMIIPLTAYKGLAIKDWLPEGFGELIISVGLGLVFLYISLATYDFMADRRSGRTKVSPCELKE